MDFPVLSFRCKTNVTLISRTRASVLIKQLEKYEQCHNSFIIQNSTENSFPQINELDSNTVKHESKSKVKTNFILRSISVDNSLQMFKAVRNLLKIRSQDVFVHTHGAPQP